MTSAFPPGWGCPLRLSLALTLSVAAATALRAVAPGSNVADAATSSSSSAAVVFSGSFRPVETAPAGVALNPHKSLITRTTLQDSEAGATMDFAIALKMQNFAELQGRVNRGEQIAAAEMAARYHPSAANYEAVVNWLTSRGFTITRRDPSRVAVFARGKVSQVATEFGVQFARVSFEGVEYTSAVSAPSLPGALAPAILGVNGLQPHLHPHKHLVKQQARANGTDGTNGSAPYFPSQIAQAYNATGLYSSNVTGAGQTIAIVIDTFPSSSDLTTFWQNVSVNQSINNIDFIQVVSGTLPSPSGEETLDVEWSSAIAYGAKVRVYATTDLQDVDLDQAYAQIYSDVITNPSLGIHQMSMSYGGGETYTTLGQVLTDNQYFAELAAAGVTIFASSGDGASSPGSGAAGDESGPLQVENPASDPNVTGVGGTTLILHTDNTESSETVWNNGSGGGGGGVSIYFPQPAWQTGTGVSGTMREVPDIAVAADPSYGAEIYLGGASQAVGGTSWSSPTCAGLCALINQARANAGLPSIGLLNSHIYPLIGTTNFRDITSGNNATSNSSGKYSATVGYDEASGIGAPNVQNLAQTLIGAQTLPVAQTVTPGQTATFSVVSSATVTGYQWQIMALGSSSWTNVTNNSTYTGALTATLSIAGVTAAMSGNQFQCVLTTGSGKITSSPPSVLVVDSPLVVSTLAGRVGTAGAANGTRTAAHFNFPSGVAVDSSGNVWIADFSNDTIREVTPAGTVTTPYGQAGNAGAQDGTGTATLFNQPNAIAVDKANNLYVADTGNNTVRKITTSGVVSTMAGTAGVPGSKNGTGSGALFNSPNGVAVDGSGNVYVADTGNNLIRKITPAGVVTTLAGSAGTNGYANGTGTAAVFNLPISVAVDSAGNVYVADLFNYVVRKITPAGVVTTPYGQVGVAGHLDGIGTGALFNAPFGVAVDSGNNLYVADSQTPPTPTTAQPPPTADEMLVTGNNLVRRASAAGVVSTIAGEPGVSGSGDGTGSSAQFYSVQGVAISSAGVVYLADTFNQTIREGGITPVIVTQLGTQTITAGQSVTFAVSATGTGNLTYQWYLNGATISGATNASYTITDATMNAAGTYTVVVTDAFGSTTSNSYALTVNPAVPALPAWGWMALPGLILLVVACRLPKRQGAVP